MTFPAAAVSFEIIDLESGNSLASFEDPEQAHDALAEMVEDDPEEARHLILVFFDKAGEALGSRLASDLMPA